MCNKIKCKKIFNQVNNFEFGFIELSEMLNKCNHCVEKNSNKVTLKTRNAIGTQYSRLFFQTNGGKNLV